jgi:hypothetical protein
MRQNKKDVFKNGIDTYAINLLWINREKKVDQKYIHRADTEEQLVDELFRPAVKWAKSNPEADINIWYDSNNNNEQALANTQSALDKILATSSLTNIKLRDIREIEFVKVNEFLFDDGMPIYYRIDLLKLITSLSTLQSESKDAVVFSDLDVGDKIGIINSTRMNKAELFDTDTMSTLEKYGIITSNNGDASPENKFLQFVNSETTATTLRHIINSSALVGSSAANVELYSVKKDGAISKKYIMPDLYNVPFLETVDWFPKFYNATKNNNLGECQIKVKASVVGLGTEDELIDYNPDTHGYVHMGNWINTAVRRMPLGFVTDYTSKVLKKSLVFQGNCNTDLYITRETCTRYGRGHSESGFSGPKIGSEPFQLKFWEKKLVEAETNSLSSEL